jgi:hypothetical protein
VIDRLRLGALVVMAVTLALAAEVAARDGAAPGSGTSIEFHGWSPDSQYVAYTRTRRTITRQGRSKPRLNRRSHHRRVRDGRFKGTGPISADAHVPRYAERRGYVTPELDRLEVSDTETWYVALEGTYKLRLSVGEVLSWELLFQDTVIERRVFDTIYVSCEARIYPSPDRGHAILVMHLNRGWKVDGAVYPVALPASVAEAWAATQVR